MDIEETDPEVLEAAARMWDNLFDKLLGGEGHYEKEKKVCEAMGMTYREMKGEENG
jgi:hypothetical protein